MYLNVVIDWRVDFPCGRSLGCMSGVMKGHMWVMLAVLSQADSGRPSYNSTTFGETDSHNWR